MAVSNSMPSRASLQPRSYTHTHIISHTQHMRLWTCVVLPFLPLPGLTAARNHIYKQAIKSRLGRQREATSWALGLAAQIPDRSGLSPALSCFLQRTEVHARWAYSPPPLRRRRRCAVAAAAPSPPLRRHRPSLLFSLSLRCRRHSPRERRGRVAAARLLSECRARSACTPASRASAPCP